MNYEINFTRMLSDAILENEQKIGINDCLKTKRRRKEEKKNPHLSMLPREQREGEIVELTQPRNLARKRKREKGIRIR